MSNLVFSFYELGFLEIRIGEVFHHFKVDVCDHGVRFKGSAVLTIDTEVGMIEKKKTIYFGEGFWLALPNIEEAILDILDGTPEEVEEL